MYVVMHVTVQDGSIDGKGEKSFLNPLRSAKKNTVAYVAERLVLQETFLKPKFRGLSTRGASNQDRVIMVCVRYVILPFTFT